MTRTLIAHLNTQRVGTLTEREDVWSFEYDPDWIESPAAFDLSPSLPRAQRVHHDGATERRVQWYFDNLLPEERLRDAISKEARIKGDDAFALLEFLLRHPNQPFSAEAIMDRVWPSESDASPDTVRLHIMRLRKIIDEPDKQSIIRTLHRVGYMLVPPEQLD